MRSILINITIAFLSVALALSYAAFYCANSGEPDLAEGLALTLAVPMYMGAFAFLCGVAATPRVIETRRARR